MKLGLKCSEESPLDNLWCQQSILFHNFGMGVPKFGLYYRPKMLLRTVTDGPFQVYKNQTNGSIRLKYGLKWGKRSTLDLHDVNSHYFLKIFVWGSSKFDCWLGFLPGNSREGKSQEFRKIYLPVFQEK